MKSREARDRMQARVKATFDKHRTFDDLPIAKKKGNIDQVVADTQQVTYVSALHEVAALGEIIGRRGTSIIGVRD